VYKDLGAKILSKGELIFIGRENFMAYVKEFQYDVFISYAHADNLADAADKYWVLEFKKQLQAELKQRLGGSDDLAIFFDTVSPLNQQLDKFTNAASNSAIFLAVASPSYAGREWTIKELNAFTETKPDLQRLFVAECLPLGKGKSYPNPLQDHRRLHFWDSDSENSTEMRLSPVHDAAEFGKRIHQLGKQIQQQLELLAGQQLPETIEIIAPNVKTYVPNFSHDVLISYAAEDKNWMEALSDHLHKQLKQELETADGFNMTLATDLGDIEKTATLLIVATPKYLEHFQVQLEQSAKLIKKKTVFLVVYKPCERPESLKGLTPHKFWKADDLNDMLTYTGDEYVNAANKLAVTIAGRLKELKIVQDHQNELERLRKLQQAKANEENIQDISHTVVYLDFAPEDSKLADQIVSMLDKYGIKPVIPKLNNTDASNLRQYIENNILECDAILVLYENTPYRLALSHIKKCMSLENKRKKPFKVIAIHKAKENLDLGFDDLELQTFECPPDEIETYLPRFIEALS
jgi:TIR domain